jgi:D-beta-D-heptose 7-phosphate kinase/D-beta-D-heptose 1-phosphate adenosyltransferase
MRNKIKTLKELKQIIKKHKDEGKKICTTSGCFDLLHIGHVYVLESARNLADVLIILLNSDSSVKRLKGKNRPIVPEKERAEMLSALECVDYVVVFEDDTPLKIIEEIKPDLHVKGGVFDLEKIKEERALIESFGGKLITLPMVEGYSTTKIIDNVLKAHRDK